MSLVIITKFIKYGQGEFIIHVQYDIKQFIIIAMALLLRIEGFHSPSLVRTMCGSSPAHHQSDWHVG